MWRLFYSYHTKMPTNIEKLQQENQAIKAELDALKAITEMTEKEKKKSELESRIQKAKQEAQAEYQQESNQNTCEKIKAEQEKLETFSLELNILWKEMKEPTPISSIQEDKFKTTENANPSEEKPWIWASTKNFVSEQWNNVWDREKWKEESGKNVLRTAWFLATGVWAVALAYKGIKTLFGSDTSENEEANEIEEKEGTSKKNKEKGFRDKRYGKTLKWLGIGAWVGGVGYYIGKWFGWWWKDGTWEWADATDGAKDQAINTANLKKENPEKFAKYQGMWANIDSQYNQIMKKELDAGWKGMSIADGYEKYAARNKLSKEDFQATVPMCIDNEFSSVDDLLSEGGYYGYLREKSLVDLKSFLIGKGKEWIGKIMGPYLLNLTSFIPFVGDDWSESLTKWLESGEPAERESELKLFFRQYAKVVNYTQDKRSRLIEKIAEEKIKTVGTEFSTIEDALDDEEWLESHVYSDDRYKNFMGGKLHQAIDVMKNQSLFDDQLSMRMKKQMESADAQRDQLLKTKDGKDALQRLWESKNNMSPEICREEIQVCKNVAEDVKENFDKDWSYLYFWSAHAVINSDQKNIQEFLKESGLWDLKSWILESLKHFEKKFENWDMSTEDINLYKNQINSYFAMKKEILIWAEAIQQMKVDNSSRWERVLNIGKAAIGDILHHTTQSLKSFKDGNFITWWLQATLPLTLWGLVISQIGKWKGNRKIEILWRFMRNSNLFSATRYLRGKVVRRMSNKNLNFMPNWLLSSRYDIPHGDQLLFQDIIEGKVNGETAQRLIKKSNAQWKYGKGLNSLSEFMQKVAGKSDTELPAKQLQVLFNNDAKISFTKNKSLRDLFFRLEKISTWEQTKVVRNGYRQKIYTPSGFHHVEMLEKFMAGTSGQSSPFMKLSENQKYLFRELVYEGKFTKIEELSAIIKNIDKINLEKIERWKISRLAKELSQSLSDFNDISALNTKVSSSLERPLTQFIDDGGRLTDEAVETTTQTLKNNPIFNDLGEQKKLLDMELKRLDQLPTKTSVDQARLTKLEQQLTELENFEKQLLQWWEKTVNETSELLTLLKKWKNLNTAIEQLNLLKKLEGEKFMSNIIDPKTWKGFESSLDDVIKSLDEAAIRSLKGNKVSGVSDDALEALAKTFADIKIAKNTKNLFVNADDILKGVKMMVKIFAKMP